MRGLKGRITAAWAQIVYLGDFGQTSNTLDLIIPGILCWMEEVYVVLDTTCLWEALNTGMHIMWTWPHEHSRHEYRLGLTRVRTPKRPCKTSPENMLWDHGSFHQTTYWIKARTGSHGAPIWSVSFHPSLSCRNTLKWAKAIQERCETYKISIVCWYSGAILYVQMMIVFTWNVYHLYYSPRACDRKKKETDRHTQKKS